MGIGAVNSLENSIASQATSMQGGRFQREIGFAILKQIMDTQEMEAQALISMMAPVSLRGGSSGPTPTVDGTGTIVNIGA